MKVWTRRGLRPGVGRGVFVGGMLLAASMLSGCSSLFAPQAPVDVFVLNQHGAPPAVSSGSSLRLGVGPVRVPAYLNRSEVMVRVAPNRLEPLPNARWGEPLTQSVIGIFGDDLGFRLDAAEVFFFPWWANQKIDYRITAEVIRFEAEAAPAPAAGGAAAPADGRVRLWARWRVDPRASGQADFGSEYDQRRSVDTRNGEAVADALSGLIDDLAREIAEAIGRHGTSPGQSFGKVSKP